MDAALHHAIARLYRQHGRLDEALAHERRALAAADPGDPRPLPVPEAPGHERLLRMVRRILDAGLEPEALLDVLIGTAVEETGAERGFFLLTGDAGEGLEFLCARNMDASEVRSPRASISHGIVEQVRAGGHPVIVEDARGDPRYARHGSVHALGLRSVLAVPAMAAGRVVGVAYLEDRRRPGAFDAAHLGLLEAFGAALAPLLQGSLALRRRMDELGERNAAYRRSLRALVRKYAFHDILGASEAMQAVYLELERVAASQVGVLIEGESGTGKELAARAIHFNGPRAEAPFQVIACPALSESMQEAELFGYEPGAFTGADRSRSGLLVDADGGTLFLDEVAGMGPRLQGALLRVLQEGELRPLGSDRARRVDVRVLASTHRDLEALVAAGEFREDLFWRLNVVRIRLPPLRARAADIPLLARHFLKEAAREAAGPVKTLGRGALRRLAAHDWPGNVRELHNLMQRLALMTPGAVIEEEDVVLDAAIADADALPASLWGQDLHRARAEFEREYVQRALRRSGGNVSAAARETGMRRQVFQRLMKRLGVGRRVQ